MNRRRYIKPSIETLTVGNCRLLEASPYDSGVMVEGETDETNVFIDIPLNPGGAL
jgi:hypothetical protein